MLAREAGISLLILHRDIASLQAVGAQIEGETRLCHVLKPGVLPPPLKFSAHETEALALDLRWIGRRTDEGVGQPARK